MKRKFVAIMMLSVCLLCACGKKEYTGEIDVTGSTTLSFSNCYTEDITVRVDREEVTDYEACACEIIEHCIANDFKSTMFSYDEMGYPYEINATVYLTDDEEAIFKMTYTADSFDCNIKDNPEEYTLEIKNFE